MQCTTRCCDAAGDLKVSDYDEKACEDLTIGYHRIRGLAAPLRMMCYYRSQPFTHEFYGSDVMDTWFSGAKKELANKNSAINLPYIRNGGELVTQTNTCLLYLGRILGIDKRKNEMYNHMVLDQVYDWRNDLMMMVYPPGIICGSVTPDQWPEEAPRYLEGPAKTHLTKLEGFCKGRFMCSNDFPQSCDFHLFEMIDQHKILAASLRMADPISAFPKMQKIHAFFKQEPKLAQYFQSDCYKNYPHNNPLFTNFTGQPIGFKYGPSGREKVDPRLTNRMLINGQLVQAEGNRIAEVIDPATGKAFDAVPDASVEDVNDAVAAAKAAFPAWSALPYAYRMTCCAKYAELLVPERDKLAQALSQEQGKPLKFATGEVNGIISKAASLGKDTSLELVPEVYEQNEKGRCECIYEPRGVVVGICPWNFPVMIANNKMLMPILAGNTVVIKPSPFTPLTTVMLSQSLAKAFPPGVVNIVSGSNATGQALVTHPDVTTITFTGSTATGKKIYSSAGSDLKRVLLELGGNDPAIVLPGSDIKKLAPQIFQKAMFNSGQVCTCPKRLYVHASQYEEMVSELGAQATEARAVMGPGLKTGVMYGPLNNKMQLEIVEGLVNDAKANGARIVSGGTRLNPPDAPDAYFFAPTVVADISDSTRLVREEQFGPAIPVLKYHKLDEAVERANASEYGLGGSVWGSDVSKCAQVASDLQAGTIWLNTHMASGLDIDAPFGGVKDSGIGKEAGGKLAFKSFCNEKYVYIPNKVEKKQPVVEVAPPVTRKRLLIITSGSRGDIQPHVATTIPLMKRGFEVGIITNMEHETLVKSVEGVHFFSNGTNFEDFFSGKIPDCNPEPAMRTNNPRLFIKIYSKWRLSLEGREMKVILDAIGTFKPDAMIVSGPAHDEMTGWLPRLSRIPVLATVLMPFHFSPNASPAPGLPKLPFGQNMLWIKYFETKRLNNRIKPYAEAINHHFGVETAQWFPREDEALIPFGHGTPEQRAKSNDVLVYAWAELHKEPTDPSSMVYIGYPMMSAQGTSQGSAWGGEDTEKLDFFLALGSTPAYIGFGSLAPAGPEMMTTLVVKAAMIAGCRAVILGGYAGLNFDALSDPELKAYARSNIIFVQKADHVTLFPKCSCAVHHAGHGTALAAPRGGIPSVVTPIHLDQTQNGKMLENAGLGICLKSFMYNSAEEIGQAIRKVTNDAVMKDKCKEMSKMMIESNASEKIADYVKKWMDEMALTGEQLKRADAYWQDVVERDVKPANCTIS